MTALSRSDGRGLNFVRCGEGPTLLFLHFFGGSSRSWRGVVDRLRDRHDCIAVDLPGFGYSGPPGRWSLDAVAAELDDLLAEFDIADCTLIGHSMGAKIAFALALRRPRSVRGLVMVAGSPPEPEPGDAAERARLIDAYGDPEAMAELVDRICYRPLDLGLRDRTIEDHLAVSPEGWSWWLRDGVREDLMSRAPELLAPTLLISGAEDPVFEPDLHRGVAAALPRGSHRVMSKVGHLVPLEEPSRLACAIGDFVAEDAVAAESGTWRRN